MSAAEEIVEEVVDTAADLVDASAMGDANGLYFSRAGLARLGFLGGLAIVGAGFAGYKFAERQLTAKYEKIVEKEIAEAKAFYSALSKEDYPSPQDAVDTLMRPPQVVDAAEALLKYQGEETEEEDEDVEESVTVIEAEDTFADWDEEVELAARDTDKPYIISQREYLQNDPEFEQTVITYYQGDGTLADEQDEEIPYPDPIIGAAHLNMFGHGSNDERIVYIRNEALSTDFEVTLSEGKYSHEVLGFQHSDGGARGRRQSSELRRFRDHLDE